MLIFLWILFLFLVDSHCAVLGLNPVQTAQELLVPDHTQETQRILIAPHRDFLSSQERVSAEQESTS